MEVRENQKLRIESGEVSYTCPITSFLYDLMRDELSVGKVEQLVRDACVTTTTNYTNGWLARYANYLAENLKNS